MPFVFPRPTCAPKNTKRSYRFGKGKGRGITQHAELVYRTLPGPPTLKNVRHLFATLCNLQGFPESKRPIHRRQPRSHREAVLMMLPMLQAPLFRLARDAAGEDVDARLPREKLVDTINPPRRLMNMNSDDISYGLRKRKKKLKYT